MQRLLDLLFPPRADEIILRGISDGDFLALMVPRIVPATRPATISLLSFADTRVRSALHEAKYHGSERAFRCLGSAVAEYLSDISDANYGYPKSITMVPIPLGRQRMKERGFNQVDEVARRALRILSAEKPAKVRPSYEGLTFAGELDSTLLDRVRETPTQVGLEREAREANMRGAFACRPGGRAHIDPTSAYILLDDVITTGATLQAAIDALAAAGAEHIIPLALAH